MSRSLVVTDGIGNEASYQPEVKYVFSNAAGTAIHALYRADPAAGILHDWTIATFETNDVMTGEGETEGEAVFASEVEDFVWHLGFDIYDAEYDRVGDSIITISRSPDQLQIMDPRTFVGTSIALPYVPNCVAVQSDGLYAVVGHDGYLSIVNLVARELEYVQPVNNEVFDLIVTANGWAYSLSEYGNNLHASDLIGGTDYFYSSGVPSGRPTLRLHPSENSFLAIEGFSHPQNIEKYRIDGADVSDLYRWPHHAEYEPYGNLWITQDGKRVLTAAGDAFASTMSIDDDMYYINTLQDKKRIQWMDSSADGDLAFVVPKDTLQSDPLGAVHIYEIDRLVRRNVIRLPGFTVLDESGGTRQYDARGVYVFSDTKSRGFHALYRAERNAPIEHDWSITSYYLP